jgi:ADP-ribosylglycohydrolase
MTNRPTSQPPAPTLADRLAGAVWGHLVGDAVGVPYEFRRADEIGEVRFGERGSHRQPPGTWSDDGALMLALLDSLLECGFDPTDQARRALAWRCEGRYTPDGDGAFDVGAATAEALDAFARGIPAEEAGPAHNLACGNGSLMRILPLALVGRDWDRPTLVERAHRASRVTHGHPRPQVACALYVLVAQALLGGAGDRAAALAESAEWLGGHYAGADGELSAALEHLVGYPDRGGRGRVWDSFWSAWDAFAGAPSYRKTIERAIRYGNDTDTTAAIAGGLAGLWWGIGGIPGEWLAGMRGRDIVEPLVGRLVAEHGHG